MPSTFLGIETAKRGLSLHQQALQTTGHNISNADNKNYARQRVHMQTVVPLTDPSASRPAGAGMVGQGVEAKEIARIRDHFVDERVRDVESAKMYWQTRQKYLNQLEIIYNEPSEESMRTQLDRFWQSWQELSQFPEELSHRELVRTRGKQLAFSLRETFNRTFELRQQVDFDLKVTVDKVNNVATQVRDLNERILKSQTVGDNPNDLLDRRDQLLQELSAIAEITIARNDPDELVVYLGGEMLVQGEVRHHINMVGDPKNEGLHRIVWEHNDKDVVFTGGKTQALIELRDKVMKSNIERLDLLAVNLADIANEVHRDGFGLTKETNINFFKLQNLSPNIRGNFDLNGDGQNDVSAIFKMAGRNSLELDRPIGISGTLTLHRNDERSTPIYITYRPDEKLKDVIQRINRSEAGVVAYLNHHDNLVLKGRIADDNWQSNFMIRHVEDSGELLVGFAGLLQNSGPGGAFDWQRLDEINKLQSNLDRITQTPIFHPAGAIQLSDEVEGNVALIAAASGKDVGGTGDVNQSNGAKDGSNALRIAQALRHEKNMVGQYQNPDEFYNALIAELGVESRAAQDQIANQNLVMTNLENLRQSIMGVNLDEEMANMVQFQQSYNASARMLQVFNEMLDQIINRLF